MRDERTKRDVLFLRPGEGRAYPLGRMNAVFKADHGETDSAYSVSEWWLDPQTTGPGAHAHDENIELFYVIEGVTSILAGAEWLERRRAVSYAFRQACCTISRTARISGPAC